MRYEEFYKEQLEKYKRRRYFLTKRLPIILISVGVLLGIIITLIFTSGTPYEYGISDICYGDVISRTPKSFLASAEYEYKLNGSFQKEAPKDPGEYVYRICSTSLFGVKKYSKEYTFKIEKAEVNIEVSDTTVEYGTKPEKLKTDLPYNEKISSFDIEFEDIHLLTTKVWAKDVVILNELDEDITDNYHINYIRTDITFTKVPLIITLKDKEKVYDGKPLEFEGESDYEYDGLIKDAFVNIEVEGSQTQVGESSYEVKNVIVKDENDNLYYTYDYVINNGTLKVTKKDINISTSDTEITYNANNQELASYTIDEEIPDNIKVNPLIINNPDTYTYELTVNLINKDNLDVTDCYNINYEYGSVTVKKADLKVKLDDLEVTYSGQTHFESTYTILSGSLFDSELTIVSESNIREVGTGILSEYAYRITKNDNDISDCFNVEFIDSEIKINKRNIKLKPKDISVEYDSNEYESSEVEIDGDGLAKDDTLVVKSKAIISSIGNTNLVIDSISLKYNDLDVSSSYEIETEDSTLTVTKRKLKVKVQNKIYFYGDTVTIDDYEVTGLLDGDSITISKFKYTLDIGRNDILVDDEDWDISDGVVNKKSFYEISKVTGSIIYNKKPITVSIAKKSKVYDGLPLSFTEADCYLKEGELVSGQTISFTVDSVSQTNAGEKIIVLSFNDINITDSVGNRFNEYYSITCEEGLLRVLPRQLVITTGSIEKPYDYGVLTCHEYTVNGLVDTDKEEVTFKSELFYIGSIKNEVDEIKVYSNDTEKLDITSNYTIVVYEGMLTYTERSE